MASRIGLRWFPVQGYRSPFVDPGLFISHITLPTLALSAIFIALIARITRASVLEVLEEDYIRTARAKGQTERRCCCVTRSPMRPCRSSR